MRWNLGVVSNAWTDLLPESSLVEQCLRGIALGFTYVELRQRALGACEIPVNGDTRPWPVPARLKGLAEALPRFGFNLAVEVPFWSGTLDAGDPYFLQCAEAARAVAPVGPVLRLVDTAATSDPPAPAELDRLARQTAVLAGRLAEEGVSLALENSRQPVDALREVLRRAADGAPGETPPPRLCWDPMNELLSGGCPEETAHSLERSEIFEFHFKQGAGGQVLQEVAAPGDLDWTAILAAPALRAAGCPALFEIPPGQDIWQRLDRGVGWLRGLAGEKL